MSIPCRPAMQLSNQVTHIFFNDDDDDNDILILFWQIRAVMLTECKKQEQQKEECEKEQI